MPVSSFLIRTLIGAGLGLFSGWSASVAAEKQPGSCESGLVDGQFDSRSEINPDFAPELRMNLKTQSVTWKGVAITATPRQFKLLQFIVQAPNECVTFDDLIEGIWGPFEPDWPESKLTVSLSQLRSKFRRIDPTFNKIRSKWAGGFYWARASQSQITKGRLGVVINVYEAYLDGHNIRLSPLEHELLSLLIKRDFITKDSVPRMSANSYNVSMWRLNQKFMAVTGHYLAVGGLWGQNGFSLNKVVTNAPVSVASAPKDDE